MTNFTWWPQCLVTSVRSSHFRPLTVRPTRIQRERIMVAIVAGNGLGMFKASNNILGGAGVWGQGTLGQSGGRAYVNAVTGNLVLRVQDEVLSGRGLDLSHLRTYNSLGTFANGLGTGWSWDGER